ncbi:hypothetical protein [Streptomyces sp. C10-9-1]|uniref:hypothetical protein n=1 Tax=Streptomyces sp. C10-9-1 TaxID=1859285 RepID=UPI003D706110
MKHAGTFDQDDIVRARNVLLASGRRTPREEVDAYRVLARVSPASYLPLLARALQGLTYDTATGRRHAASLALGEEAVAAARSMDPADPARADVLYGALDTYQRELYGAGRRAEGLATRAEMLAIGRAQAERSGRPVVAGLYGWATGLSEEGRYAEAADALTELVGAVRPEGYGSGALPSSHLAWIAALQDAGRSGEALAGFRVVVDTEAAGAANDPGRTACRLHVLIGHARMLDLHGRGEQAALVRQEARAALTELADTGGRHSCSGRQTAFWAALLTLSGAESDRPPSEGPRPPAGVALLDWSPEARQRYFDSRHALREEADTLAARAAEDPDRHLADLVRLHRVLTIRSAVYWQHRTHLFADRVRPLFDDGVDLARRLSRHDPAEGTRTLARTLIDRSAFRAAARDFGPALDDFREALHCLGEADGP